MSETNKQQLGTSRAPYGHMVRYGVVWRRAVRFRLVWYGVDG